MIHTFDDIVAIIDSRMASQGPVLRMMQSVRDRYECDYVIPDPTGLTDDATPMLTPALIAAAVDAPALRAASVLPNVFVPPTDPTKIGTGPHGTEYASARRGAVLASWHQSMIPLLLRRGFRQLRAYDSCCFVVENNPNDPWVPKVVLRDALGAFPEPKAPEDITLPANCGFVYGKSGSWIRSHYPRACTEHGGPVSADGKSATDDLWNMVEWIDEEHIVIGILGPRIPIKPSRYSGVEPIQKSMELSRYENKARCCPVVMPQTVSLSQVASQVAKIIGHVDLQAQILALDIAATQRAIFPDRYVIGEVGKSPQLVGGGNWKEGITGEVNFIEGAKQIGELRGTPDPAAARIQETLQQHAERTAGLLPQQGGQLSGAARTGRGLDTLGAWAVDPAIQELQEVMAFALMATNKAIIRTYTGYHADRKFNVYFGMGGTGAFAKFTPNKELAEDDNTAVSYAIAGADKQGTTVQIGQQLGTKLISHRTARQKHPDVDDPEFEERTIMYEDMQEALKIMYLQRAQTPGAPGAVTPQDFAKTLELIVQGMPLQTAILQVDKERAEIQAATPEQAAGMSPQDLMPGLGAPEEGGAGPMPPMQEAPGEGVQGPPPDLDRLRMLTGALQQTSGR